MIFKPIIFDLFLCFGCHLNKMFRIKNQRTQKLVNMFKIDLDCFLVNAYYDLDSWDLWKSWECCQYSYICKNHNCCRYHFCRILLVVRSKIKKELTSDTFWAPTNTYLNSVPDFITLADIIFNQKFVIKYLVL